MLAPSACSLPHTEYDLLYDPEDGSNMFAQNVGLVSPGVDGVISTKYTISLSIIKVCVLSSASELLGLWTLFIVRYSRNQKTRRFGNWICFRSQS
jgi:hypothetical protein